MTSTKTIRKSVAAAVLALAIGLSATPASAGDAPIVPRGLNPIKNPIQVPKEIRKASLPWWYTPRVINTHPEIDKEHPPLCIGNTYYARFTDAESPTADLRVMFNYQNTSGEHVSVRMTMRPGVEDHVVTVTDLQEQPHRADNMFSVFAWDPEGAYFAQWVNGDCLTNGDEAGVPR